VDVRNGLPGRTARPDRGDDLALADGRACCDSDRAEVRERDRVTVGRLDREALAARGNEASEAHRSALGRYDRIP